MRKSGRIVGTIASDSPMLMIVPAYVHDFWIIPVARQHGIGKMEEARIWQGIILQDYTFLDMGKIPIDG
jgi:hypothetical protein